MRWAQSISGMRPVFDNDEEKREYEERCQQQWLAELRGRYPLTPTAWEVINSCQDHRPEILRRLHRVCVVEGIPSHADQGLEEDFFYYRVNRQWHRAYTNYQNLMRSGFRSNPGADPVPAEADAAIVFMEEPFNDPPIYIYVRGEGIDLPYGCVESSNAVVAAASRRICQALQGQGDLQQALISFYQVGRCPKHRLDAAQELGSYLGSQYDLWGTNDPRVHQWLASYCRELYLIIGDGEAEMILGQQRREGIILGWLRCDKPLVSLKDLIGFDLTGGIPNGLPAEDLAYLMGVDNHLKGEWLERLAACINKERQRCQS